ncbi:methyl-accepting chemotaxis protein [Psychromarinibacter sediminicola]|uniref:methyl-accepting chemotaxis protein n=1 Tax=Psychromarinibacter sediminicola TaxID=3033385 RepID=UPI00286968E6|nr:methyl-accepting chemotaxis protein [Psychromarinibacter sediminicola]
MGFLNNIRITSKLPAIMLGLVCLAVAVFGVIAERAERQSLTEAAAQRVAAVLASEAHALERSFERRALQLSRIARETTTLRGISGMATAWAALPDAPDRLRQLYVEDNPFPAGNRQAYDNAGDRSRYSALHALIHRHFVSLVEDFGYHDILLLDTEGNLVYSVAKAADFATNMARGPWRDSGLADVWTRAMQAAEGEQVFADFEAYAPRQGAPAAFLAQPVFREGERIGAVVVQLRDDRVSGAVAQAAWLGETGEIFLVGPDYLLRSNRPSADSPTVLTERAEGAAVRAALADESGELMTENAAGVPVLRAYHPVEIFGTRWAAIADVARSEALAGVADLRWTLFWNSLAVIGVCALVATAFSMSLSRPLGRVTDAIARISGGALDTDVPETGRGDEIGQIAGRLEDFREKLSAAEAEQVKSTFRGAAFSASTAAIFMVGPDGRIDHANRAARTLFEGNAEEFRAGNPSYDGGDIRGQALDAVLPREVVARLRTLIADAALPARLSVPLGELRLELDIGAVLTGDGEAIGHVIELKDVTSSFLGEAVMQSIDAYQLRADFLPGGGIVAANAAFCNALETEADALRGRDVKEVVASDRGPEQTAEIVAHLRDGKPYFGRYLLRGPSGAEAVAEGSLTPVTDAEGALLRYIMIATDVTEAQRAIRASETERREAAAAQETVVETLRAELGRLAGGDMTARIDQAFAGDYEQLRRDFNTAAARLSEALSGVAANAEGIRGGAAEISSAADDMSARTERQAATLEETAAALDQLTASVKSAAEGAAEANRIVDAARNNAETSGAVVREAVNAMSEIAESSKQISRITEMIDDISYQTNLLALNAGVEAARAGEAGRGFAVVASEVRALAQRSSDAAQEINDLISASGQQVRHGVDLVGQAGDALTRIAEGVIEISRHVSEIADSSRKQSTGLAEINEAVGELDQVTQQNAAMFEEATAAGHGLTREAEMLARAMAQFRTGASVTALHRGSATPGTGQGPAESGPSAARTAPAGARAGGGAAPENGGAAPKSGGVAPEGDGEARPAGSHGSNRGGATGGPGSGRGGAAGSADTNRGGAAAAGARVTAAGARAGTAGHHEAAAGGGKAPARGGPARSVAARRTEPAAAAGGAAVAEEQVDFDDADGWAHF